MEGAVGFKVVVFGGSLRFGSYSSSIMNSVVGLAPAGCSVQVVGLQGMPVFNQDQEKNLPAQVAAFKKQVKSADAILVVTPEYNYSFPGYLKNALDWASRPYGDNSLDGLPGAIISCSPGLLGGSRALYHLRQVLSALNVRLLNRPEVIISGVDKKLDAEGRLHDEETARRIRALLDALIASAKE